MADAPIAATTAETPRLARPAAISPLTGRQFADAVDPATISKAASNSMQTTIEAMSS